MLRLMRYGSTLGAVNTVILENGTLKVQDYVYGIQKSLEALDCQPCKAMVMGSRKQKQ